jgi:arylformamidase
MTKIFLNYDQAQLDAQYNNRARVPNFQEIIDGWAARSADCLETMDVRRDLAYGDHHRERLDVFPAAQPNAPVHVFFHGGYWQALSKDAFAFVAAPFAAAGVTTVLVNYPLAPHDGMDRIVDACRSAAAWVHREIHAFNGDAHRIVVSGHSAGGHIAAMLVAGDRGPVPAGGVKGVLSISGLFDLEPIRLCYLNAVLGLDAGAVLRNSPLNLIPHTGSHVVAVVGERESEAYHWQTERLAFRWGDAGTDVTALVVPSADHFSILDHLADPDGVLFKTAMRLLTA